MEDLVRTTTLEYPQNQAPAQKKKSYTVLKKISGVGIKLARHNSTGVTPSQQNKDLQHVEEPKTKEKHRRNRSSLFNTKRLKYSQINIVSNSRKPELSPFEDS